MDLKVILNGDDEGVPILREEIPKVIKAAEKNKLVVLKHGVINGAYFVGIKRVDEGESSKYIYEELKDKNDKEIIT